MTYLTSPHLISSQPTPFHLNWVCCDWSQPRQTGLCTVNWPSLPCLQNANEVSWDEIKWGNIRWVISTLLNICFITRSFVFCHLQHIYMFQSGLEGTCRCANEHYESLLHSVLWRCWLGGRKSIRPVNKLSGGMLAWLSVWVKMQICIWPSWCYCHSLSVVPINPDLFYLPGFTFLVPAHPGSPGQNPRGP